MFKYYPAIHYYRTGVVFVGMIFVVADSVVYLPSSLEKMYLVVISLKSSLFWITRKTFQWPNIMMGFLIRLKRSQSSMDVIKRD